MSRNVLLVLGILLVTLVAYFPVADASKEFTNWDDQVYVTNQPLVRNFTVDSIPAVFSTERPVATNYHPLTILSMGLTASVIGPSAQAFVGINLLLHLANTALVFVLVLLLSNRRLWAAGLAALWFGIHPLHVESVAWASERKDVLYTLFLLLSLLSYIRYVQGRQLAFLGLSLFAFIASCLSKAMAVPLPLALVLVDYWYDRKIDARSILEKVPFLAVSLVIGLLAISIQSSIAIADFGALTMPQRIAFASYGFVMYWVKTFLPVGLVTYYPYPPLEADGEIASWYFLMPFVALALLVVPLVVLRRRAYPRKVVIVGMGFFVLFVALVLQFLQVGTAVMADRYTYVPTIGSFFLLSMLADWLVTRYGKAVGMGLVGISLLLVPVTIAQVRTWTNSETLWSHVIKHYPYTVENIGNRITLRGHGAAIAYAGRGEHYYQTNRPEQAFNDLLIARAALPNDPSYAFKLGILFGMRGQSEQALELLNTANQLQPNNPVTLYNRGITYAMMNRSREAIADFTSALASSPDASTKENLLVGLIQEHMALGENQPSLQYGDQLLQEYPANLRVRFLKGTLLLRMGQPTQAVELLRAAVERDASYAQAWYNLAVAQMNTGDKASARSSLQKARSLGLATNPNLELQLQ
ncbi:MAG: hypothetical protein RL594_805 [Bacteroidota bacterium]|jgi:tetratricopeptide (TPR) repeat protein